MPSRDMPAVSARMWVLPTSTERTPKGRRWSPMVISPAFSGTKFQLAPCACT